MTRHLLGGLPAAILLGACAAPAETSTADRERIDAEYRTGSNFPRSRDTGVQTYNREAIERAQQSGPPGGYVSPHGGAR